MEQLGYMETTITGFNSLMGGLPVGSGVLIYGPPEAGKTILEFQLAYEVALDRIVQGRPTNLVVIDTEGSDHTYADWHETFNKTYGEKIEGWENLGIGLHFPTVVHSPTKAKDGNDYSTFKIGVDPAAVKKHPSNVFVFSIREITEILAFFGKPVKIEPSEGGKFAVKPQPGWKNNPVESALGRFMREQGVGYLAVDSLTNPTKQLGTEQANLPARAQAIGYLMTSIQGLSEKLGLATVMVSHEGQPGNTTPQDKYKRPMPLGGNVVLYNVKYSLYLNHKPTPRTPSTETYKAPTREFWVARHPSRQPWTTYRFLTLGPNGFVDS